MSENQEDTQHLIEAENPEQGFQAPFSSTQPTNNRKSKDKKRNKKKGKQKRPQELRSEGTGDALSSSVSSLSEPLTSEDSEALESLTETPQTILNLPVKPDEWFIQPPTYDEDGNLLTEETFIFLKDGIEVVSMALTENNFAGLSKLLNERFNDGEEDTVADYFHVRKPLSDSDDESDPVMTLTQRNRILATTSLDQKTLKKLIRALQKHIEHSSPVTSWLNQWWHKHKIWRVILIIAALPLAALFLYSIFWAATH